MKVYSSLVESPDLGSGPWSAQGSAAWAQLGPVLTQGVLYHEVAYSLQALFEVRNPGMEVLLHSVEGPTLEVMIVRPLSDDHIISPWERDPP